jgi:hypothetical protein
MSKKEAINMLLEEGKKAVEKEDYDTLEIVSDCLSSIDEYADLYDTLYKTYKRSPDKLFDELDTMKTNIQTAVDTGFPYATELLDVINQAIEYFTIITSA